MEQDFPEIEDICPADAWRTPVYVEYRITHEDLDILVAQFITSGGKVEQIATGVQNATTSEFNGRLVSTSIAGLTAAENQRAKEQTNIAKRAQHDAELLDKLNPLLSEHPSSKDITATTGISYKVLQRLLATYFHQRRDVDYLRAGWREPKPQAPVISATEKAMARGRVVTIDGCDMKLCPSCKEVQLTTNFYLNSGRASGINTYCKSCEKALTNTKWSKGDRHEQPSAA